MLSIGPYSAVPAEKLGLSDQEWIRLSGMIRRYHECTHFVCRNLYPDLIDAVWDELVADAVGLTAAFGSFDADMEKLFLGIEEDRYIGGRLENYAEVDTDLVKKVTDVLDHFSKLIAAHPSIGPYELAILLEENKGVF